MQKDKDGTSEAARRRREAERRNGGDRRSTLRWDPRAKERRAHKDRRKKTR